MDVGHDVLPTWLEVSQEGDPVGDRLEVVDSELQADGVCNGYEVENSVSRAPSYVDHNHGVLEGRAGDDIPGLDVLLEKSTDGSAGVKTFLLLLGGDRSV